jgi:hypothetical protein
MEPRPLLPASRGSAPALPYTAVGSDFTQSLHANFGSHPANTANITPQTNVPTLTSDNSFNGTPHGVMSADYPGRKRRRLDMVKCDDCRNDKQKVLVEYFLHMRCWLIASAYLSNGHQIRSASAA